MTEIVLTSIVAKKAKNKESRSHGIFSSTRRMIQLYQ